MGSFHTYARPLSAIKALVLTMNGVCAFWTIRDIVNSTEIVRIVIGIHPSGSETTYYTLAITDNTEPLHNHTITF